MMRHKRVTIKDIAERCQTTANTVSRALRGDPKISAATIERIRQAAAEMGYIRNNLAATMRSGKSRLISVIIDEVKNPHYAMLVDKIDSLLEKAGYDTMTLCTQSRQEKALSMANLSISNAADGIFFFPDSGNRQAAELIRSHQVPLVLIHRGIAGIAADVVRYDDEQGGRAAAKALFAAGHRKFAYLRGPEGSGAQPLRQQGFTDELQKRGITAADITYIPADKINAAIRSGKVLEALQPLDYTAIFSFNDQAAYYAMNALRESGCRVPEEIAIIGFDHIRGGLPYLQPLSSMANVPQADLAERSVALMLRRIEEPEAEFLEEVLPIMLYEGQSTIKKIRL